MMTPDEQRTADDEHAEFLAEVTNDFSQHLRKGTPFDLDDVVSQNPELGEELAELLDTAAMLERMREQHSLAAGGPVMGVHVPDHLGEFKIIREVGRGGMGIVFEAVQHPLSRRVAVKVLPKAALWDSGSVARFRREAATAARLHHSHIVPVYGVGQHDGCHFYAMQFIEGETLAAMIKRRRTGASDHKRVIDPTREGVAYEQFVVQTIADAADALSYAHAQGTLHRDIKPSNLLLDVRGHVWIADFGLALRSHEGLSDRTKTVAGTAHYMAPEQLDGRPEQRSDVYSLGLVLYELLTLQPAFDSSNGYRDMMSRPARPRSIDPTIPRDLETIVLKATATEATDRYKNAAAFAEDLRLFAAGRPIRSSRTSLSRRLSMWSRRNPGIAAASTAAVTLLVALIATLIVSNIQIRNANELTGASARSERAHRERADLATDVAWESLERILARTTPEEELLQSTDISSPRNGNARLPLSDDTAVLLQELLETFQKLAAQDQRQRTRQRIISAKYHAGIILGLLGRLRDSEDAFESALALADSASLDEVQPDQGARSLQKAKLWNAKGRLARTRREFSQAGDAHATAIKLLETMLSKNVENSPSDLQDAVRLELATAQYSMAQRMDVPPSASGRGRITRLSGDRDETVRTLDQAMSQLVMISEPSDEVVLLLARCRIEKSSVLRRSKPQESASLFDSAVGTLRQLSAKRPSNSRIRSALAIGLSTGVARDRQLDDQQVQDFESRVDESIQHAERLTKEQPNALQFQFLLQQLRHKHGTLLTRLHQHEQAERTYRSARNELVSLESLHPSFPVFSLRRAFVEQSLARLLIELGQDRDTKRTEAVQLLLTSRETISALHRKSGDSSLLTRLDDIERLFDRLGDDASGHREL